MQIIRCTKGWHRESKNNRKANHTIDVIAPDRRREWFRQISGANPHCLPCNPGSHAKRSKNTSHRLSQTPSPANQHHALEAMAKPQPNMLPIKSPDRTHDRRCHRNASKITKQKFTRPCLRNMLRRGVEAQWGQPTPSRCAK